jgi:molybdopterin molybdotransferase
MKTVAEALALVLQQARVLPPSEIAATNVLGLMLAEDVASDVDSPPHDKSVVDGFAVRTEDFSSGRARLEVVELIPAGRVPSKTITAGQTTQIMTGAPLPSGADAIVMVERTNLARGKLAQVGDVIELEEPKLKAGQNIMRRGISMRQGEVILKTGSRLRPIELGLLAEVGRAHVKVHRRPVVGILATGDELVRPEVKPTAGQIRNSNGPLLAGMVHDVGGVPIDLGIAVDTAGSLRERISAGLTDCDVLLLSGGVSAGVLDLVPQVLAELGVEEIFHQVSLKPGKPLWFGTFDRSDRHCLVFGLPGNPVSSFVCFALFVRPVIDRMLGRHPARTCIARLTKAHSVRGDRATYWPARLIESNVIVEKFIEPLNWHGSGDLRTLAAANALAIFPNGGDHQAGEEVEVLKL